jgi:hypothetical protein
MRDMVRHDSSATVLALDADVILRRADQVCLDAVNKMFRMLFDPGMSQPHVIGDEVEHEFHAAHRR